MTQEQNKLNKFTEYFTPIKVDENKDLFIHIKKRQYIAIKLKVNLFSTNSIVKLLLKQIRVSKI